MKTLIVIPHDKALHVLAGVLVFGLGKLLFGPTIGLVLVVGAAVGKELYDLVHRDKHTPDVWDAVATVLGGILGVLCHF